MLKNWKSMGPFSNTCLFLATPLCIWNYGLSLGNRQVLLILVKAHSPIDCYFFLGQFRSLMRINVVRTSLHYCVLLTEMLHTQCNTYWTMDESMKLCYSCMLLLVRCGEWQILTKTTNVGTFSWWTRKHFRVSILFFIAHWHSFATLW